MLVLRLLSAPKPDQHPVWFVIDELASLQKLPQLHTAITENRKSRNPLVLGFQGKAQLEVIYGHLAEVMLSQPATKIFLRTTEPNAAEWVSRAIGKVEIERMKETHFDGHRSGRNFALDRQTEPLVLDSEISRIGGPSRLSQVWELRSAVLLPPAGDSRRRSRSSSSAWRTTTSCGNRAKISHKPQRLRTPSESPTRAESKPISDGHNGQSAVTNPAHRGSRRAPR